MHILAKYTIAVGLILFGIFAFSFQTYEHPVYGHIDLGTYHAVIGIISGICGVYYMYRILRARGRGR